MQKLKQEWSKSYPIRPRDHLKSHIFINEKKHFKPSYENDDCPPPMNWIIGWEYARKWLNERTEYNEARKNSTKPKRIKNDYQIWLEKRKPKANKICGPQGSTNKKFQNNNSKTNLKTK